MLNLNPPSELRHLRQDDLEPKFKVRLGYLLCLERKSGCRQDMEQKQNGCRMWQNQAGSELVVFKDPEGVTQTPEEENNINGRTQL